MTQITFKVQAFWDTSAEVWVATSDDVPGLATEASTIEDLTQKLREMIPGRPQYDVGAGKPRPYKVVNYV